MAKSKQPQIRRAVGRKVMKSGDQEGETALFKLKAGRHRGADYSQEPVKRVDPITGVESWKYPSKDYVVNDIIESEVDLTQLGREKFELISGRPRPMGPMNRSALAFPHGQVHDGLQQTTTPGDVTKTGPKEMTDEEQEDYEERLEATDKGSAKGKSTEVSDDELESMSVEELKELAEEQEIDLRGKRSKHDIIDTIRKG